MRTKFIYLLSISSLLVMGSCATSNQNAQQVDQNDDVYYSEARAKEKVEVVAQTEDTRKSDYVTEEELYGDAYSRDYAVRINRFRNYAPWRGYYNNIYGNPYGNMYGYGNVYNNFYDSYYSPYNFYGGPMVNLSLGFNNGFYNYNPWRYYGYNYGSNFMGPYTYYNPYGLGFGGGYYGNNGFYGNGTGVGRPVYTSPNYRPRPVRGSDDLPIDPGAVNGGNVRGVSGNGNGGNVIQDRTRAGRYNGGTATTPSTGTSRPATTAPRPERVSQQPQRTSQPERVNSSPPPSNNNGGGGRSNESGGSSSGGRPTRGN